MARRNKKRINRFGDDPTATVHNAIDFSPNHIMDDDHGNGYDSGTEEEQEGFKQEVKVFHMERGIPFKPPKFYREEVNLLKLWKVVMGMGGYEHVTSSKLWRNVGELFNPPKTCTTLAFAFRGLYQTALLEYENHKNPISNEKPSVGGSHKGNTKVPKLIRGSQTPSRSGRPTRNSAIRAKQVWQSLKNSSSYTDEVKVEDRFDSDEDKATGMTSTRPKKNEEEQKITSNIRLPIHPKERQLPFCFSTDEHKSFSGMHKANFKVFDIGPPANWVKINVFKTTDGFEVYALIPGLTEDDVQIQYNPAGHIVILGQPENPDDNPWGLFPFKKVIKLPSRINPHKTAAVVTLHGQLFIRAPFEQSNV